MREVKYGEVNPGDTVYPDGITGTGFKVMRTLHENSADGPVTITVAHPDTGRWEAWTRPYRKLIQRATPQEIAAQAAQSEISAAMDIAKAQIRIPLPFHTTVHEPTRTRILQGLRRRRRNLVNRCAVKESARDFAGVLQLEARIVECSATINSITDMTEEAPDA